MTIRHPLDLDHAPLSPPLPHPQFLPPSSINTRAERLCNTDIYKHDTVIIAGDVSDDIATLTKTLQTFSSAFKHTFFIPGNHDIWVRRTERGSYDSLGKLAKINHICAQLGVHTKPTKIANCNGAWIFPILSWYHASWDREPDILGATPIEKVMLDFHVCSWTSVPGLVTSDDSIARHFDELNEPHFSAALQQIQKEAAVYDSHEDGGDMKKSPSSLPPPIISFSHFLPLQSLLPEKRWLHFPNLAKACGSDYLADRVKQLSPMAHIYGHTHFSQDTVIDGTRYIQWPLGYPAEQKKRRGGGEGWGPMLLYDAALGGGMSEERDCYWSRFYRVNKREPAVTQPAPWANTS